MDITTCTCIHTILVYLTTCPCNSTDTRDVCTVQRSPHVLRRELGDEASVHVAESLC